MSAVPHGPVCRLPEALGAEGPAGESILELGGGGDGAPFLLSRCSSQGLSVCRTERQYRDLAYCVSQLPLTERGLRKMLDNFECFGDKLSDESVFSAFLSVVGKLRRGAKPEGKVSRSAAFQR